MWKRKDVKRSARSALKRNYLAAIGVCFIMMMFFGRYTTSKQAIISYNPANETREPVVEQEFYGRDNLTIVKKLIDDMSYRLDQKRETDPTYATKGVLSTVVNHMIEATGPLFKMIGSIESFIQNQFSEGIYLLVSMLLSFLVSIFIVDIIQVGEKRFFLESRLYKDTPIRRIFYLYKNRQILRPAKILFLRNLRLFLWALTLIMYPIKYFEYFMIPYIVAENPEAPVKEVFRLSKQMTAGNKWRLFVWLLSYWYWYALNLFSFGLVGIFFSNPYRTAAEAEIYTVLRQQAIDGQYEGSQVLCDVYLTAHPAVTVSEDLPDLYPSLLKERKEKEKRGERFSLLQFDRPYTLPVYILLFFSFSILGWLWEVGIHLVEDGQFVNRGVLLGPWLPIYGSGGVLIIFLLRKMGKWPIATFLSSMALCSVVEYFTSWMLEMTKGAKWWDYSGYLFNLNGRMCLEGALVFGLGGCLFIYILAPSLDRLYQKLSSQIQWILCVCLLTVFLCDMAYSYYHPNMGEGITDYDAGPMVQIQNEL